MSYRNDDFYKQLNLSVIDQYTAWTFYRRQVTDLILESLKQHNSSEIMLIGIGNSNDIELSEIALQCEHMVLVDIDENSLNHALRQHDLSSDKVDLLQVDLSCIDVMKLYEKFKTQVDDLVDERSIKKIFTNIIKRDLVVTNYEKKMDVIIISPIYSQLVYRHFEYLLSESKSLFLEYQIKTILTILLDMMPEVIEQFNQNIVQFLKPNGMLIVLSDLITLPKNSMIDDSQESLELTYLNYYQEYGYGLGDYGIYHLKETYILDDHKYLIWPFNDVTDILVLFTVFK